MDPLWIIFAFIFGFSVKQFGLPPLVGFLMAGFALHFFGVESSIYLQSIADFGVLLLLFSIGLKLRVKNLLRPEIWAGSSIHMLITVLIFGTIIFVLSAIGFSRFSGLDITSSLLIAFALSFSSTIFAVKILEETGTMTTAHGRVAIGILVMQDIFAVLFLTLTSDDTPSPWAFALLLLIFIPKLLQRTKLSGLLDKSGHGELLILLGVLLPLAGASLFGIAGLKPDLGALIFGILLAEHPRAKELAKSMLSFKDLFLVGFFLTIGLSGSPSLEAIGISLLLTVLIPIKVILFFAILTKFRLRARTSFFTSFSLANYSEFGLIVGAAGVAKGWLSPEWLVIFALSLSFTFILASPLNMSAQKVYIKIQKKLLPFETKIRLAEDEPIVFSDEEVIVFGMGRTGIEVYNIMEQKYKKNVLGIDINMNTVLAHQSNGKKAIQGDATDINFWQRISLSEKLPIAILATSSHATHMNVVEELKEIHCNIKVAAISRYDDELEELKKAGVEVVFNLYEEAGAGFANHVYHNLYDESNSS